MTTLLRVVQEMLISINGDQVSSYNETAEARRCATIAEQVFIEFVSNTLIEDQRDVIQLHAVGDVANPTQFLVPNTVDEILQIEYKDSEDRYRDVDYLTPQSFLDKVNNYVGLQNTQELTYKDIGLVIRTDYQPRYWTSFDNKNIIMDAYEIEIEASLQQSKIRVLVSQSGPELWDPSDNFIIPLDSDSLATYKAECLERAWAVVKERDNGVLTRSARKERAKLHHRTNIYDNTDYNYANFGRCSVSRKGRPILNRD